MKKLLCVLFSLVLLISALGVINVSATETESIPISSINDFAAIEKGKTYHLTQDINLGGTEFKNFLLPSFSGTLDGGGYSI